jgi:hypothetical protein
VADPDDEARAAPALEKRAADAEPAVKEAADLVSFKRARGSVDVDVSNVTSVAAQAALAAAFSLTPATPAAAAASVESAEQAAAEAQLGFSEPPPPLVAVLPPQTAQGGALEDTPVATTLVAPASGVCGPRAEAMLAEVRLQCPGVEIAVQVPEAQAVALAAAQGLGTVLLKPHQFERHPVGGDVMQQRLRRLAKLGVGSAARRN